jgi:hypothetical protein
MPKASLIILSILLILAMLAFASSWRANARLAKGKAIMHMVVFASLITVSSLFWTKDTAYGIESIKHLEYGWPVPFVVQNQDRFDPPFPYLMRFAWELSSNSPNQLAQNIKWKNFVASITINFFIASAGMWLFSWLIRRRHR